MRSAILLLVLVSFFALTGCKSREAAFTGTWTASTGGIGPLEVKADKTFVLTIPLAGDLAGKWQLTETSLVMTPERVGNRSKEEAIKEVEAQIKKAPQMAMFAEPFKKLMERIELKPSDDDKKLSMSTTVGGQTQTVEFTKSDS